MGDLTTAVSPGEMLSGESEESLSLFFDFDVPSRDSSPTSQISSTTKRKDSVPKSGTRVSLACIPCRSRHVKCSAEVPGCSRCLQDDKPCFYAKSRRGMRDGSHLRKKDSLQQGAKGSRGSGPRYFHHDALGFPVGAFSPDIYTSASSSSSSSSPEVSTSRPVSTRRLIDLFYTFFYKVHPFVLPRYYFLSRLASDPCSVSHLRVAMQYAGSLYSCDSSASEYRDLAVTQLELDTLPTTGFTVQTLLITAIALHFEGNTDLGRSILDTAILMAIQLSMNLAEFAIVEPDQVLAESWRRTYWGICSMDSTFGGGIRSAPSYS